MHGLFCPFWHGGMIGEKHGSHAQERLRQYLSRTEEQSAQWDKQPQSPAGRPRLALSF